MAGMLSAYSAGIKKASVFSVDVNSTCGHGCGFCARSCRSYDGGNAIQPETVRSAREKFGFLRGALLTGGEPLDHPRIAELAKISGGVISTSNGFSDSTHLPSTWDAVLPVAFKHVLDGRGREGRGVSVSFSIFDRWKGESPGRDALISFCIKNNIRVKPRLFARKWAEAETYISWLDTVARVAGSVPIPPKALFALLSETPFFFFGVGRGAESGGMPFSWPSTVFSFDELFTPIRVESLCNKVASDLPGLRLNPDGSLSSYYLCCNEWMEPKHPSALAGNISEDPVVVAGRLSDNMKRHFALIAESDDAAVFDMVGQFIDSYRERARCIARLNERMDDVLVAAGRIPGFSGLESSMDPRALMGNIDRKLEFFGNFP
ncbi:MAG: radical SAM protein [Candidatus Bilamarchaeaceae archaeon]